ncbi:MAG: pentapeptide repeat-containing protein [bacterium]|nr:pentapeptide repeat-containing protein [bacterium]
MAVGKHLDLLNRGTSVWNGWRTENPRLRPGLSGARLEKRDFRGIDFLKVNLSGADLRDADLRDADLGWADLSGANLSGANLTGARLLFTDLTGANLKDAVGLEEDQVDEAVWDDGTILPEGVG